MPRVKQPSPQKQYCLTYFGDSTAISSLADLLIEDCVKFIGQEEVCPTTKRLHLQAGVWFKKRYRLTQLKTLYPDTCHWEPMKNGFATEAYCKKSDTCTGRRWEKDIKETPKLVEPYDPIREMGPYKWQQDLLDVVLEEPDPRAIYWYWEETGHTGKTLFCRHLCLNHNAVLVGGRGQDSLYAIAELKVDPKIVLINFPRDTTEPCYNAIEAIKDGIFFTSKYKSGMKIFNPPHVVVFSNAPPMERMLSRDRWRIHEIVAQECERGSSPLETEESDCEIELASSDSE